MDNWKKIWGEKKTAECLSGLTFEECFMELKYLTGNDTVNGGVPYNELIDRFNQFFEELSYKIKDKNGLSVFEVGCGSGANLLLCEEKYGMLVGGLDYSSSLIEIAKKVLKQPIELCCGEAIDLSTCTKYDIVFSNSAFEYFPNKEYAYETLDKMCRKAKHTVGVLEVHDVNLEKQFISYRRSIIPNYDEKYQGLQKLFLSKDFFVQFADEHKMDIKFAYSNMKNYWNSPFVYDVYLYSVC